MKKSLLFLLMIMFLCLPFFGYGQRSRVNNGTHFHLGIKAGVNFNKNQGDHIQSQFKGYFLGGLYMGIQVNRIRIRAEGLFTQNTITTGAGFDDAFNKYVSATGKQLQTGTIKMNDLAIPVLFGYHLIPNAVWLEVGPQYTATVSVNDFNGFFKEAQRVVKSGYVSGVVGLSIDLPLHLRIDARYIFGLTNRNNTDVPARWSTNHLQVALGFGFL